MKQVIIHLGFHKTATSSIQLTCFKNKDKLEELGFHYPLFNLDNRVIDNHSIPFYSLFTSDPYKYHINIKWGVDASEANKKYEEQLNYILKQKYEKIIISGEDISALSQLELDRMKKKIQSYGYDIRVIIFVRPPHSLLNSQIQQLVKGGDFFIGKTVIKDKPNPKFLNIKNRIEKIEYVFPEADFFSFRDACQHKYGPVGNFFEIIGVSNFSSLEFFSCNESISAQATRLISFINKEQRIFINGKINPFRRFGDMDPFHRIKGDKFQLNENEFEQFKDTINQENEYLLNKFDVSFYDEKPYLTPEIKESHWSDEQLEQLKIAMSKVHENIKIIAYDYFKNIICLDKKKLSYVFFKKTKI